jgi:SSS family transporter
MLPAAPPTHLHAFDLALIVLYLVGITLFGLRFRSGKDPNSRSLRSYFLADQTIPWWAIALSIVSAETSTLTIISIPGVAFAGDFGFLQIVIGYMLGRIVVAAIFLPKYFQGRMLTAYQLIDQRFGGTLHKVTAGLFLLTRAAAEGVRVFAVSIVIGIAIGTGDVLSIGIISALTLLYTFEGGMTAVIWTDVIQMFIYVGGTIVAISTLGTHVPGGWSQIHAVAAAAGKFRLFHFALNLTQSYTFWAGIIGGTFLTMASHGTDQLMVQRMLAARNLRESRLALLASGAIIFLQFTLFLLIGAGLYVFYGLHPTTFASADRIFPTFIVHQMPIGIAGLLIAAILAAAMSNLSAALNSLSSTTVVDFYMHLRPHADDRERMMISRSSTVVWAFILFAVAVYSIHVGGKGHVVEIGLSIASVAYGALLGVFLLGTLTKYATQTGAIIGMITGFALNMALWLQPHAVVVAGFVIPKVAFTWYVFIGSIVTFAIGSLASLIFRKQHTVKAVGIAAVLLIACASPLNSQTTVISQSTVILSEAKNPRISPLPLSVPASRYLKASALGLSNSTHISGLQPLGYALLSNVSESQSAAPKPAYDFTPISTLLNAAIVAKKLPGAVVLIGHDNKIVFEQVYGNRKLDGEPGLDGNPSPAEPMTEYTIFDMASLTKCLVTATAIMQLYEAGKLQFDDPVAKYLPAFAANGKENVTIRQLLTHYSGLPADVDLKDPWGLAAPDKAEGIRRAMESSLEAKPGTTFKYSDINFITLGTLVEKLSGQTLDIYAQQQIFIPLQMDHISQTTFHPFDRVCGPHKTYGAAVAIDPTHPAPVDQFCAGDSWRINSIRDVAPTAHDNEGTPATNPNFEHLLRGTVHDPTTRRMGGVAGHAGVFSTAADISLFAQALLDKLLQNTGPFPLKQSTLRLMTTPQQPATAQSGATVFTPDGKTTTGIATRGFGWDINTAFSRPRGEIFPIGSFGHTGFTGTSLWMDPTSNTYVILLANAVYPRGNPPISALRGQVATAAARALGLYPGVSVLPPSPPADSATTLTGIEVLQSTHFDILLAAAHRHNDHLRLGLLTNQTGLDSAGHRTIDILFHSIPQVELKTLFSPEHGILGAKDTAHIANDTDPTTHLPVISLYGPKDSDRRPTPEALKDLDAVVIDLQDAGVRFYTYESVVGYFLEAAAKEKATGHTLEIILLDRPNPINGIAVQGPVSDAGRESYINYMPLPIRHGLTLGELARYINGELRHPSATSPNVQLPLNATLTVVSMQHWNRTQFFDDTHLPWTNPSPNLRSLTAAILYPGLGLLDSTNVSVGRGTDKPFEHIGAPYIDAPALADYLTKRNIPGVSFSPTTFAVVEDSNHYPSHGKTIPGIALTLTDRNVLDSPELGIEIVSALQRFYPTQFNLPKTDALIVSVNTMLALKNNEDPRAISASWKSDLEAFKQRRQAYLLYP